MAVVQVTGLVKRYVGAGEVVEVLSGLDMELGERRSLALTGRSGSGKSTVLNLLCGLEAADRGRVGVLGEMFQGNAGRYSRDDESRWAALRRRAIGVVFQESNLMPALSLLENVRFRARLAGQPEQAARDWLERLGIGELAGRYPDQVSGGQRQRAALAMAFAMNPGLILADEPTGSLDHHTADDMADCLFSTQQETGCSLILATHDLALAARCQSRLDLGVEQPVVTSSPL